MYQAHIFQHLVKIADIQQEFRNSIPFFYICQEHLVIFLHFVKSAYTDFLWSHFLKKVFIKPKRSTPHYLITPTTW